MYHPLLRTHTLVRQFNSRNGPAKAEFAYLCTSGCCRLWNSLLSRHCNSWAAGVTAGKRLESGFLEFLAATSDVRSVSESLSPQDFYDFGQNQKSQGAKSGEYGGWSIFVLDFLARNSQTLNLSRAGELSWRRIHSSGLSSCLFLQTAPFPHSHAILLLLVSRLIFDLSAPRFILYPRLYPCFAFLAAHFSGHLAHLLALPHTAYATQKHSISS
jgi:hypothetical protein